MAILLGPDLVPKSSGNVIRNVLDGAVDDVGLGHFHQVADTASDEALEDEDVTLSGWLLPGPTIILKLDEQISRLYGSRLP